MRASWSGRSRATQAILAATCEPSRLQPDRAYHSSGGITLLGGPAQRVGAPVHPDDRRPGGLAVSVDAHEPVELRAERHRPHPAQVHAGGQVAEAVDDGRPPVARVLLGPSRPRVRQRVRLVGRREPLAAARRTRPGTTPATRRRSRRRARPRSSSGGGRPQLLQRPLSRPPVDDHALQGAGHRLGVLVHEDVAPDAAADGARLHRVLLAGEQLGLGDPRAAGEHGREAGGGGDQAGVLLARAGPVRLDDVGAELGAQADVPEQVVGAELGGRCRSRRSATRPRR